MSPRSSEPHPRPLRVLLVQNHCTGFGGDDVVVANESALLRAKGHAVRVWALRNEALTSFASRLDTALRLAYNRSSLRALASELDDFEPDIVHCHNLFPRITPAAYDAAAACGVPVVQTVHDFRAVCCANGFLLRAGRSCELCLAGSSYWAAWHRCYRGSWIGSLLVAHALAAQRRARMLERRVQRFIALSIASKRRLIAAGLPRERIAVKPNFVFDPGEPPAGPRHGALFVGRLSAEKGLATLMKAWSGLRYPLRIVGTGPLAQALHAASTPWVTLAGHRARSEVAVEMQRALFLVVPSAWIEGFPLVLAEAFAHGLPVIASRLGVMTEVIEDGATGLHFEPGDAGELAAKVRWAAAHEDRMAAMGAAARRAYVARYDEERNYQQLMQIYARAARAF